ncbi:MAG: hypothetical protein HWD58_00095 [Bacteroidota bacterium]|nr:MAG: hypothetical protein HWD58_00095 [Bacteroidota bacterium]
MYFYPPTQMQSSGYRALHRCLPAVSFYCIGLPYYKAFKRKNAWFILSGASMVLAWCTYESSWAILILTPLLLYWKARPNFRQWLITMTLLISLFGVYLFFGFSISAIGTVPTAKYINK